MYTSHELNGDYLDFFKSLKRLCVVLNSICDLRYMVIDASKAMAYAIKKGFYYLHNYNGLLSYETKKKIFKLKRIIVRV